MAIRQAQRLVIAPPSHTLHTYWIGNIRMVLDVEVQGGKASSVKHSLPRMRHLIEWLAPEERPALVRGDNAFGNERVMSERGTGLRCSGRGIAPVGLEL